MNTKNISAWVAFVFSVGGYIPLAIGVYRHPVELNIATFSLWAILSALMTYSAVKMKFPGWRMQFGWLIGNIGMLCVAAHLQRFTFNLDPAETIALYGIIITVGVWLTVGKVTGKLNDHILFIGVVATDVLSYYPQFKQYLLPHESPTIWLMCGWAMFFLGAICNIVWVDEMFKKLFTPRQVYPARFGGNEKNVLAIFESSAISFENAILIATTIFIMS